MSETYDLAEARLLLGREATRHGDWTSELHAAAAVLLRELATLDQINLKTVAVTVEIGAHLSDPHSLRIEFVGGERVAVTYNAGRFVVSDPGAKRPQVDIDLHYNAFSLASRASAIRCDASREEDDPAASREVAR
jgi:hypothetical protein